MLLRDFIEPDDPILKWKSFFKVGGRMSRRAYWRASWSAARWTFGVAIFLTILSVVLGGALGGATGALAGLAVGIALGVLFQAIPITALTIQRLHDFGWSAKILILLLSLGFGPLIVLAGLIATRSPQAEIVASWLVGCALAGFASYIALGWFLLGVEAPKKENQFGPAPVD